MVQSPPKKAKKNSIGPRYIPDQTDELSDENNDVLSPGMKIPNATTLQQQTNVPVLVREY